VLFLAAAGFGSAADPDQSHAAAVSIVSMQKSIDGRLSHLWPDEPFFVLGTTHGVYLNGYGAVFTAEVNLVTAPISPFMPTPTKEMVDRHHQRKLERVPQLKQAMRELLAQTAASLDTLADTDHVVLAVSLTSYAWEPAGLPSQIVMQGQKGALVAARNAGTQLDSVIKAEEY
jgi:predicted metalloprotease with PDZ domain